MYEFDGKEFGSLKDLAKYAGINEKTLTARIRRGMPVEPGMPENGSEV